MSQYPNPPQPQPQWQQGQWQPPPPPPGPPPGPRAGVWIAVTGGVLVLFSVSSASPRSQHPGSWSTTTTPTTAPPPASPGAARRTRAGPAASPMCRSRRRTPAPRSPRSRSTRTSRTLPDAPEAAPAGDAAGFAQDYLARVAAGDAAGVDEAMCAADQEWQYEDAVSEGRVLGLSEPRADDTAPGGLLADLTGPEGTVDGRITVLPTTPTAGVSTCSTCSEAACPLVTRRSRHYLVAATAW